MATPKRPPKRKSQHSDIDRNTKHRMGKNYGYTDHGGGVFELAPILTDALETLLDLSKAERKVAATMLEKIQASSVEREARVSRAVRHWWQNVADELDIDLTVGWEYDVSNGTIRPQSKGPLTREPPLESAEKKEE